MVIHLVPLYRFTPTIDSLSARSTRYFHHSLFFPYKIIYKLSFGVKKVNINLIIFACKTTFLLQIRLIRTESVSRFVQGYVY